MSFKSNGTKRDTRKILSGIVLFVIFVVLILSQFTSGFSVTRLIFAGIALYLATAFYRLSNEV